MLIALQARRNMLREGAVAVSSKAPTVDLESIATKGWNAGYATAVDALNALRNGDGNATTLHHREREADVSAILASLPTREA